jgi:hypothetical protein
VVLKDHRQDVDGRSSMSNPTPANPAPLTASQAIAATRRWLWLALALRLLMMSGLAASVWMTLSGRSGILMAVGVLVAWLGLGAASIRSRRLAMASTRSIAVGDFDDAERKLGDSIRSFSVIPSTKVFGLHQLASLRSAQQQWGDVIALCGEIQRRPRTQWIEMSTQNRILMAESQIETGDVLGAALQIQALAATKLNLRESMSLMLLRLDHAGATGDHAANAARVDACVPLAELLPARSSAKAMAILALACHKTGRSDMISNLRRRAELLCDVNELLRHRPMLAELWPGRLDTNA